VFDFLCFFFVRSPVAPRPDRSNACALRSAGCRFCDDVRRRSAEEAQATQNPTKEMPARPKRVKNANPELAAKARELQDKS
jgi:hypothetical protein